MSEDVPSPKKPGFRKTRPARPTRKLSFPSRIRGSFRKASDRVLDADALWSVAFVLVTLLLLGNQRCGLSYEGLAVGEPAPRDIKAGYDLELPDEELTEERRRQAIAEIPEVWVHDSARGARLARELSALFQRGRQALEGGPSAAPALRELSGRIGQPTVSLLQRERFAAELEQELAAILRRVMRGPVVGNKALLEREPEITVVEIPGDRETRLSSYEGVLDLDAARERARAAVAEALPLPESQQRLLGKLLASFIDTNLALSVEGTRQRRQAAVAAVPPVLVKVARGTLLVQEGEEVTPAIMDRLESAGRASSGRLGVLDLIGLIFLTTLLAFFLYRYASYHQRHFKKIRHLHALLVLVQLGVLLLAHALLWVAGKVVQGFDAPFNQLQDYNYLVPLGAGSIMIALLANGRISMVYASFTALLFGAMNAWDPYLMTWGLLVQWGGIYAISTYRERAALIRAGLVVGLVGAASALALETLKGGFEAWPGAGLVAGLAFVGGAVGVGLVVSFALPLLEGLFRVLTDVRLLELSNSNTPLLSELAVKAPGSYNHSLVVGTLAEEGAKAIGANSLFCRVAAVYHDIGKMLKPEYYVENQGGENPHDKLSPSMSALVVMAHVKDGIKLAREAGLPEQIVDIIPQHHGTRLMTYFYEKAKKRSDPSMGPIKQEDFRYPGPKPQTREAAIFMLADGIEAAARTLDEPSLNKLREVIRKVTDAIVLDRQLVECDLTFVDLDRIQKAFLRVLVSMYHHRVDYPGFDFGKSKGDNKAAASGARRVARGR